MAMYIMNGETFLSKYINEDPNVVLNTQYAIVSNQIRKAGRYEGQVINANAPLYPNELSILDYETYDEPKYVEEVESHFEDALPFLAVLINYCLDEDSNIVFLCSQKEWKYRYLKILKDFILEKFEYHIYDYKKLKSGKEQIVEDDEGQVSAICRKILKRAKKEQQEKLLSTDRGRDAYVKDLDKSKMIKKLKDMNLYVKGMSKDEMRETLSVFL